MEPQPSKDQQKVVVALIAFALLVAVPITVIGLLVGIGIFALIIGIAVGGTASAVLARNAQQIALNRINAIPADDHTYARLHNLVEGLCGTAGLAKPSLYVLKDDSPNALALGRSAHRAAIVITTGMLDQMTRVELEAVLAHELGHIKSNDIVGTLFHTLLQPSDARKFTERDETEQRADRVGVALTRYPPGLISALEKVQGRTGIALADRIDYLREL